MRIRLLCLLLYIGKKILSRCFIGDMFSSQLLVYGIFTCLHSLQSHGKKLIKFPTELGSASFSEKHFFNSSNASSRVIITYSNLSEYSTPFLLGWRLTIYDSWR